MGYYTKARKRLQSILNEGLSIVIAFFVLLVIFAFFPAFAETVLISLNSIGFLNFEFGIGAVILILDFLFVIMILFFVYLAKWITWMLDTNTLEDRLNNNIMNIIALLGHGSYSETNTNKPKELSLVTFLEKCSNEKSNRFAWFRMRASSFAAKEKTPIGGLRNLTGMSFWRTVQVTTHVRLLEMILRQSTQAPSYIIENPVTVTVSDLPIPQGVESPFSEEELEIIEYQLKKSIVFNPKKRGDYVKVLEKLTKSDDTTPSIISRESISSIIRLADKQYDFKVTLEESSDAPTSIWGLDWNYLNKGNAIATKSISEVNVAVGEKSSDAVFSTSIFENNNIERFHFDFVEHKPDSPALGNTSLGIKGYTLKIKDGLANTVSIIDNVATEEFLSRNHRILLDDLFENEIIGTTLTIEDPSNIRLLVEGFIDRQFTIRRSLSDANSDTIPLFLLRLNAIGMIASSSKEYTPQSNLFTQSRIDSITGNMSLAVSGLLGLKSLDDDLKTEIKTLIEKTTGQEIFESVTLEIEPLEDSTTFLDIPKLNLQGTKRILADTRKTEDLAKLNSLVWSATGAGAWIHKHGRREDLIGSIDENQPKGLILFHLPLRERVFLEALTHRNYHYIWEILRNRIDFMEDIHAQSISRGKLDLIWTRESFLPSGNAFVLNDDVSEKLDFTDVHTLKNNGSVDLCIMLTRSNQLIRGPVNGLNMIFAESSKSLSPLPAMAMDFVLRQRMYEEISHCISTGNGLLSSTGKPTKRCYAVNWLRPLRKDESTQCVPTFEDHVFSRPTTWNHLGFLDIIVKETKCAYALVKLLTYYMEQLRLGNKLPFKLVQNPLREGVDQDIEHISSSYDFLCDFLTGDGDFKKKHVHAMGIDRGYLEWLGKALDILPQIGEGLQVPKPFEICKTVSMTWLEKLQSYVETKDGSLHACLTKLLDNVGEKGPRHNQRKDEAIIRPR